jgi:hypothetical protein
MLKQRYRAGWCASQHPCPSGGSTSRTLRLEFLATCLTEWPNGEPTPTQFWLADRNISFRGLVDLAKLRWRIGYDYHDKPGMSGIGIGCCALRALVRSEKGDRRAGDRVANGICGRFP